MTRNHYKMLAERRKLQLDKLLKQLRAEKRVNNALSKLAFVPNDKQNPARLKEVRKAITMRQILNESIQP